MAGAQVTVKQLFRNAFDTAAAPRYNHAQCRLAPPCFRGAARFPLIKVSPISSLEQLMPARILIAEDYDDNRELLRLMLEGAGYDVRETRDGRELLEAARSEPFDLVLVDLSMPHLDGFGALRELRAEARTRELPCVAVTAFAGEQDRLRAFAAGFDAYVAKPFRSRELLEAVERLLGDGARDGKKLIPHGDGTRSAAENDGGRG
jgi:CheY-like chemotaxis protein